MIVVRRASYLPKLLQSVHPTESKTNQNDSATDEVQLWMSWRLGYERNHLLVRKLSPCKLHEHKRESQRWVVYYRLPKVLSAPVVRKAFYSYDIGVLHPLTIEAHSIELVIRLLHRPLPNVHTLATFCY
jgi:hypothetical protein